MTLLFTILVTFFAGMGAGLGTGFAGMSAAAVISPMLITFLDVDPYMAVGIALSSDVLASAVSAYVYGKNKSWRCALLYLYVSGFIMPCRTISFCCYTGLCMENSKNCERLDDRYRI